MKPKLKDETGNRYGRLTVLRRYDVHDPSQRGAYWLCRCDCGVEVAVLSTRLRNGNTRSCGCLREMSKAERLALGFEPIYGRKRAKSDTRKV